MIKKAMQSKREEFINKYKHYYSKRYYNMSNWTYKKLKRITAVLLKMELKK